MNRRLAYVAVMAMTIALFLPVGVGATAEMRLLWSSQGAAFIAALLAVAAALSWAWPMAPALARLIGIAGLACGAAATLMLVSSGTAPGFAAPGLWLFVAGLVLFAWQVLSSLARASVGQRAMALLVPALFGLWLLYLWQVIVVGLGIPQILLPPPSKIGHQLVAQAATLWVDFQHTFLVATLAGFAIGCSLGFLVAVLTDRVPFLQRGLLPLGNLVSAVPIVGIAPIMVMWFGFGWESKAAVIVISTFFPMLINTIAGLAAADHMSRDLMRSYGSSYWQTLLKLRLPAALPFIFNALKINSTLAFICAIVAEMFCSPIYGMGFRISTEVYKMDTDVAWATIAVAALAGSLFYGLLALLERQLTFWHPSYRSKSRVR
jgi:NitT/TauT family transport system permease protein